MNTNAGNGKLTVALEGRVDTNNAAAVEQEINDAIAAHAGMEVQFDAGKLEYISSAGLRVLMKLRKQLGRPVTVFNVSRDVYDIFETTGFTKLLQVQKAYREISTEGLEVIGQGFYGTVYRMDKETIVKMYKGSDSIPMIENEKKMAQKAFLAGIPTAISYDIVKCGEDYGSVFELLNARTFHDIARSGDEALPKLVKEYCDLLKLVHQTAMQKGDFPSYKERFLDYLEDIGGRLTKEQYEGLKLLLTDMPDETTVVHGDIQMKNVMQTGEGPMLIDMETLGLGNPVFEFAGLYMTYQLFEEDDPDNAMSFLQMTPEMVDDIWNLTFETYFSFKDDDDRQDALNKIRLAAAIRFLYLLESTDLKDSDLGRTRIAHAKEHINELLGQVDRLAI